MQLMITSALAIIQFLGHLAMALSDGKLTYEELKFLLSTASGIQLAILLVALVIYYSSGRSIK